jgi:hypothetical protein
MERVLTRVDVYDSLEARVNVHNEQNVKARTPYKSF